MYIYYTENIQSNTNYLPYALGTIGFIGFVYVASLYLKDRSFANNLNNYADVL